MIVLDINGLIPREIQPRHTYASTYSVQVENMEFVYGLDQAPGSLGSVLAHVHQTGVLLRIRHQKGYGVLLKALWVN